MNLSLRTLGRHARIAPEGTQGLLRHADIRTTLEIDSHATENGPAEWIEG
jgi:hypothetical protein